jgi:hypothetical protein
MTPIDAAIVETLQASALLRVRWKELADLWTCAHLDLKLEGRYLRWKGTHLRRSLERYTCNGCGESVILHDHLVAAPHC